MSSAENKTTKRGVQMRCRLEVCTGQKRTCHLFLLISLFYPFAFPVSVSVRDQESNLFISAQQAFHACSSVLTRGVERARLVSKRFSRIFPPIPLLGPKQARAGNFATSAFLESVRQEGFHLPLVRVRWI